MGIIFDIQRFCIDDGPGIRTTIFFKGCPLRCQWCHNPESWDPHIQYYTDTNETVGYDISAEEILNISYRDMPYYTETGGGITLSGGEPLMQHDFTLLLLRLAKERGLHTCLETSGYGEPIHLYKILPYTDLFLYDIKCIPSLHHKYTGQNSRIILDNLDYLYRNGAAIRLRCPIIPGINDTDEHFTFLAALMKNYPLIEKAEIMPYHNMGVKKALRLGFKKPFSRNNPSPQHLACWNQQLDSLIHASS